MSKVEKFVTSSRWTEEDEALAKRFENGATGFWTIHERQPRPVQCRVWFVREGRGYSAVAPDLPGVVSQGKTLDQAEQRIREAFAGAFGVYREAQAAIPWERSEESAPGEAIERWIVVDG